MGTSQSKRERDLFFTQSFDESIGHRSLMAAIGANKRQRKLLLKQAKLVAKENMGIYPMSSTSKELENCNLEQANLNLLLHNPDQLFCNKQQTFLPLYSQQQHLRQVNKQHLVSGPSGSHCELCAASQASCRDCDVTSDRPFGCGCNSSGSVGNGAMGTRQQRKRLRQPAPSQRNKFQTTSTNTATPMSASSADREVEGEEEAPNRRDVLAQELMVPTTTFAAGLTSRQLSRETLVIGSKGFRQQQQQQQQLQQRRALACSNFPVGIQSSTASTYSSKSSASNTYATQHRDIITKHSSSSPLIRTISSAIYSDNYEDIPHLPPLRHERHLNSSARLLIQMQSQTPRYQRGLAYNEEERKQYNLLGLLPAAVQDQDLQVKAVMNFIDHCKDELSRYVYLRHLKDFNEHLFYSALMQNVEKLMPLVYTPTVGLACQKFSEIYTRPRGLFVTSNDHGRVSTILANWSERDVRVIVVTDGERILGLGDLGANGMGISIGKLSLYTALAGIPPQNVLPVTIDVGTNNETFLSDPFYIGLKQNRIRGEKYDALIEEFMQGVVEKWGSSCLIQFEDFANATAFKLLQRYRNKYCTFNDDIQGTASVCLSGLISASKLTGRRLADSSYLFYGAGEANLGTANLIMMALVEEGLSQEEAKSHIWLVDSKGLVVNSRADLNDHKRAYARNAPEIVDLEQIIEHTKPGAIIGASAQGGAFTESICRKMAQLNERPIIFALSNPTSKAECTADQAYMWTDGQCVFASGSPFDPVVYGGKTHITGQGNNAYIFPGVGLAAIAAHVHSIPEDTFLVAARALSDQLTAADAEVGLVYPRLSRIREVTLCVATRVLEHFYSERLATYRPEPDDKKSFLRSIQYDARYEN